MNLIKKTPLYLCDYLSKRYNCKIFLKREDLQKVRSFKIRGAFNKIHNDILNNDIDSNVFVTASAGNHAQGVSYVCNTMKKKHHIF